jgi:sulfopyruvate decarboxylase TPP-binding subunit
MFSGAEIEAVFAELNFTHVVWIPDTATGPWEASLASSSRLKLVRVCREGEAWPLAAGLYLGGAVPVIVMQSTGLFESGDSLRNVLFDLRLPLYSLIGVRNGLVADSRDSAKLFTEPVIKAWGIDRQWISKAEDKSKLAMHCRSCRASGIPGVALLAEGAP